MPSNSGKVVSDHAMHRVLGRLEALSQQMDGLMAGQRRLEEVMRQQLHVGGAAPCSPTATASGLQPFVGEVIDGDGRTQTGTHTDWQSEAVYQSKSGRDDDDLDHAAGLRPREGLRSRNSISSSIMAWNISGYTRYSLEGEKPTCSEWFIAIHPESNRRAFFDIVSLFVLLYDAFMIPYQFAWNPPLKGGLIVATWVTLGFWIVDLMLGFVTGYRHDDRVVMSFRKIACKYTRTFFFPNLLIVASDLVGVLIELSHDGGAPSAATLVSSVRIIKLNRIIRIMAMLRTGQLALLYDRLVATMRRHGLAEQVDFMVSVLKLVFEIIWVNHFGCCMWYMIADTALNNWYQDHGIDRNDATEYLLGFYWSTSTMIAGESVMTPTSTGELVTTNIFLLFGFIFSSVLISSLATTLIDFTMSNKEPKEKLKTLRQFLYQHSVRAELGMPIEKQVLDRMSTVKRLSEKDVSALSFLSPLIRAELYSTIYGSSITSLQFIRTCNALDHSFVRDVCFHAMFHATHEPGDQVLQPCTDAVGAHVVYWGSLEYMAVAGPTHTQHFDGDGRARAQTPRPSKFMEVVGPGRYISELALWAHWRYRGWMEAATPCEVLTIQAESFLSLLSQRSDLLQIAQDYSVVLCGAIAPDEALSDLQPVDHESALMAMPTESRAIMSNAALQVLSNANALRRSRKSPQELADEVQMGKCDLILTSTEKEKVLRLVSVVAIRIRRKGDKKLLAQIGAWDSVAGSTTAQCALPGTKVRHGETPTSALERLIKAQLALFSQGLILASGQEEFVETRPSDAYGLPTKYLRTVFEAELEAPQAQHAPVQALDRSQTTSDRHLRVQDHHHRAAACPMTSHEAFLLAKDNAANGRCVICSWLPPNDFDTLSGGAAGAFLVQKWVSDLMMTQDRVNRSRTMESTAVTI